MRKPFIAIQAQKLPDEKFYRMPVKYTAAIFAHGGIPLILPLIASDDYLDQIWPVLDGLVLSGCHSDLNPSLYGEAPHPSLGPVSEERDRFDWLLLRRAHEEQLPLLGICRGFQSLNVFRGGKLIQDVPGEFATAVDHDVDDPARTFVHGVRLATGTILNPSKQEAFFQVNSEHHQAVREPGAGLKPIAWSEDGLLEAVQGEDTRHYVLGVQWHPERTHDLDKLSQSIFKSFMQAMLDRRSLKSSKNYSNG
ncbi:MAG: gamma-glutamyl-gamma-aminobutyrate hydrolase family protein [bacterium]